jgi:hypothetical protein
VLFDDYFLKQIQKIAEFVAALAAKASGRNYADVEADLDEAYRAVLGMNAAMADRLSAGTLAGLLRDAREVRALALLVKTHGDVSASCGDPDAARVRWEKALAILAHGDDPGLREEITSLLARL